jgi:hypothetical protein
MSLFSKRTPEENELLWIETFLKYAINGDELYVDIIKPILLESANYANKKITVCEINRAYLHTVLALRDFKCIKKVTPDDLKLKDVYEFIYKYNHTSDYKQH